MADETHTVRCPTIHTVASRQDEEPSLCPLRHSDRIAAPPCPDASRAGESPCAATSDVREGRRSVGEGLDATWTQP
jgi:hypothetical protein